VLSLEHCATAHTQHWSGLPVIQHAPSRLPCFLHQPCAIQADSVPWLSRCRGEIGAFASGLAPEAYDSVKGSETRQQQWQLLLATAMRSQVTLHLQCQDAHALSGDSPFAVSRYPYTLSSLPDCRFRLLKAQVGPHKLCLLPTMWTCCATTSHATDNVRCVARCALLFSHTCPANTPRVLSCRLTRHCQSQRSELDTEEKKRKHYTFRRQSNEKPNASTGLPDSTQHTCTDLPGCASQELMAATLLLENMLRNERFKPHWRICNMPAPSPSSTGTHKPKHVVTDMQRYLP